MEVNDKLLKRYQSNPDHMEIAEISFKAGKQQVVDWVNSHINDIQFVIMWQKFLKENNLGR